MNVLSFFPLRLIRTFSSISEAVPKRILELMNVPGLSRENVASHLQVGCILPYLSHMLCCFGICFIIFAFIVVQKQNNENINIYPLMQKL